MSRRSRSLPACPSPMIPPPNQQQSPNHRLTEGGRMESRTLPKWRFGYGRTGQANRQVSDKRVSRIRTEMRAYRDQAERPKIRKSCRERVQTEINDYRPCRKRRSDIEIKDQIPKMRGVLVQALPPRCDLYSRRPSRSIERRAGRGRGMGD